MSRKSAYVGWFGRLNLPTINDDEKQELKLENLNYANNRLSFKIVRYVTKNVAVRYTTVNYERYPVEWKKSTRSAVIFKLDKTVNIKRYCEVELLKCDIPDEFKLKIIAYLEYVPTWRQKEIDLQNTKNSICILEKEIDEKRNIEIELGVLNSRYNAKISGLAFEKSKLKIYRSSTTSLILRIIFSVPTLFLSWIGYISSTKAQSNAIKYRDLVEKIKEVESDFNSNVVKTKKYLEKENRNIEVKNKKILKEIKSSEQKIIKIEKQDYTKVLADGGFIDLRKACLCVTKFDCKGVYIIWNKSKDKYYVGQSKDVYKRLFTNHFKNGDVNNILFARDWDTNDRFFYKIIELSTKDELDAVEKENIEKYDSFRNGYNNTGGNR